MAEKDPVTGKFVKGLGPSSSVSESVKKKKQPDMSAASNSNKSASVDTNKRQGIGPSFAERFNAIHTAGAVSRSSSPFLSGRDKQ